MTTAVSEHRDTTETVSEAAASKRNKLAELCRVFTDDPILYQTFVHATNRLNTTVSNAYIGDCQQQLAFFVVQAGSEIASYAALLSELAS